MTPHERALADASPTFADLCDQVRRTRVAYKQALAAREAAEQRVKDLKAAEDDADDAESAARSALDRFIDRETEID